MTERQLTFSELVKEGDMSFGDGYRTKKSEHGKPGLPILRVAEVQDGAIRPEFADYVSGDYRAAMGAKVSRRGDVVLTTKGTVGRVAIIPSDSPEFVYSPQVCFFRVPEKARLFSRYLYYWFKTPEFWHQARSRKSQTDMADYLNLSDIRSLAITVPSRVQQQAVVDVLGAVDDKIVVNERVASIAESLCRSIFLEQSWGARTNVEEIAALHKEQVSPETLGEAVVAHYSLPAFDAGATPDLADPRSIKSAKFTVRRPSVLLSKLNPETPRVWNVSPDRETPALASTEFLVLEPQNGVTAAELWAVLSQPGLLGGLAAKVTGTSKSHQRVRPAEVMASAVVDPRALGDARGQARVLVDRAMQARNESRTLATLRDTLLPQLMSGKLRVRDAEKIVEDAV